MKGAWALATTQDLFRKLEHDLDRIRRNQNDRYAAYDFFVTAFHMLDWLHPDPLEGSNKAAKGARDEMMTAYPLLHVAGHIANGSKHYVLRDKKWDRVAGFAVRIPAFGRHLWGPRVWAQNAWAGSRLVIRLTDEAGQSFGNNTIEVVEAAESLVQVWREILGLHPITAPSSR